MMNNKFNNGATNNNSNNGKGDFIMATNQSEQWKYLQEQSNQLWRHTLVKEYVLLCRR